MKHPGKEYYIFYQGDDGPGFNGPFTEEGALKRVEERWYGNLQYLDKIPEMHDGHFSKNGIFIIEGSIVVPKPVTVATSYKF